MREGDSAIGRGRAMALPRQNLLGFLLSPGSFRPTPVPRRGDWLELPLTYGLPSKNMVNTR